MMVDRLGQQFGNYRLVKLLGKGGFAEVYLAEHLYQEKQVAIKILPARLSDLRTIHRFRQEARAVAHLEHPNLVRVIDFGVESTTPYLVMYYAPNGTLRQRHPRGNRLPLGTVVSYVTQIADALQYAHNKSFVYRNVKPANMLIGEHEELLLSGFSMAVLPEVSNSTAMEEAADTMLYMAPEQIQGHPQAASDQYALAVVAYEWLCGALPFQGTGQELVLEHLSTPPLPLEKWIRVAPEIEEVIMRALSKDPGDRFASVQEFASALAQAAQKISFASIFPTQTSTSIPRVTAHTATAPAPSEPISTHIPEYTPAAPPISAPAASAPQVSERTPGAAPFAFTHTPPSVSAGTAWPQDQEEQQSISKNSVSSGWPDTNLMQTEQSAPFSQAMPPGPFSPAPDFLAPTPFQPQPPLQVPHTDYPQPEPFRLSRRTMLFAGGGVLVAGGLVYLAASHFAGHGALTTKDRPALHTGARATSTAAAAPTATNPGSKVVSSTTPRLYTIWKGLGTDQRIFWSSLNGGVWMTQQQIPGQLSSSGPVLANFGGRLYVAWKGPDTDTHIHWASFDKISWTASQLVPKATTSASPALAVLGNKLYMVWSSQNSTGQSLNWSSFEGQAWTNPRSLTGKGSSTRPVLASFGNKLYLAWKGAGSQSLFWASFDGTTWSGQQQPGGAPQSSDGPALASFGNKLYLAWKGADSQSLFWASFDGTTWSAQQQVPNTNTNTSPALASFNGQLSVSWTNVNQRTYWNFFNGTAWSAARSLGAFSSSACPVLTFF